MASSNRHWPSFFKSKPQWHHDINSSSVLSTACHKTSYASGREERTSEPKPRWNPRPEQIRILEAIFNSGMVNPPRDEIRKIRARLQEYGQVGDANVFYWFQNRKSRSKQKRQLLQNTKSKTNHRPPLTTTTTAAMALLSNLSSNNSTENAFFSVGFNSSTGSSNQSFLQAPTGSLSEPYFFAVPQPSQGPSTVAFTQGFCFPHVPQPVANENCSSSLLLSQLMLMNNEISRKAVQDDDHEKMKLQEQLMSYGVNTTTNSIPAINVVPPSLCVPLPLNQIQGVGESGGSGPTTKSTVFINDVCFKVTVGELFNVKEVFGDDAVLINSSGQPVLTNEWGVTVEPLQHGGSYYLLRTFTTPFPADDPTLT